MNLVEAEAQMVNAEDVVVVDVEVDVDGGGGVEVEGCGNAEDRSSHPFYTCVVAAVVVEEGREDVRGNDGQGIHDDMAEDACLEVDEQNAEDGEENGDLADADNGR